MLNPSSQKPIRVQPQFLYIEPTSVCNLHCRMCYTNVINGPNRRVLDKEQILGFVRKHRQHITSPLTLYWCGTGEVMMHPQFPEILNTLLAEFPQDMEHIVQTNGTVDRLDEISDLAPLEFRISIDGLRARHEWHRGDKTYDKTLAFCRKAVERGCRGLAVRLLLTRENILELDEFHAEIRERIGPAVRLLLTVPFTNPALRAVRSRALAIVQKDIEDQTAVSESEARQILFDRYQDRYELDEDPTEVTNYLSLTTYGVFSCCHGIIKIGSASDDMDRLYQELSASESECRACPMFPCV